MHTQTTQLLILGGGPGGYVAAIRAAQLGLAVTLVEAARLGGTCLNIGCIPSKAVIHAAAAFAHARHYADTDHPSALGIRVQAPSIDLAQTMRWKDGIVQRLTGGVAALLKKHKVRVVQGWATVLDGKTVEVAPPNPLRAAASGVAPTSDASTPPDTQRFRCEHLLLATGSQEVALPMLPFGGSVISSTQALSLAAVPQRLLVVGAGYIGLELGCAYARLGAHVHVIEAQDRILPAYDAELTKPVQSAMTRQGIKLHLSTRVQGLLDNGQGLRVVGADGATSELAGDVVLVAAGRRPRTEGWGLENLPVDRDGAYVKVDTQCRTSMRNVWAIGDLTGEPMLAHRAMAQGELTAEVIAGHTRHFQPAAIPAVCFTDPEVVSVGVSPTDAQQADVDCLHAAFPFAANGRAMTLGANDGFVRVVARRDNHRIIGWQAVGAGVSELAAAFTQSLEMGAVLEDVAGTIHAHPTLGEAVQEAALRALGQALHI